MVPQVSFIARLSADPPFHGPVSSRKTLSPQISNLDLIYSTGYHTSRASFMLFNNIVRNRHSLTLICSSKCACSLENSGVGKGDDTSSPLVLVTGKAYSFVCERISHPLPVAQQWSCFPPT